MLKLTVLNQPRFQLVPSKLACSFGLSNSFLKKEENELLFSIRKEENEGVLCSFLKKQHSGLLSLLDGIHKVHSALFYHYSRVRHTTMIITNYDRITVFIINIAIL